MSRSGYHDDDDQWRLICWRGAVAAALRGKRGQRLLREMLAALDAMPEKRLIATELVTPAGDVCALGAAGQRLGLSLSAVDPEDYEVVARTFGVSEAMVREVAWVNDDEGPMRGETEEERWTRVRAWVVEQVKP